MVHSPFNFTDEQVSIIQNWNKIVPSASFDDCYYNVIYDD